MGCDSKAPAGHASSNPSGEVKAVRRQTLHYFDIVEPAAALEYLELELDRLIEQGVSTVQEVGEAEARSALMVTCQALCTLIKQECEAEVHFNGLVFCAFSLRNSMLRQAYCVLTV